MTVDGDKSGDRLCGRTCEVWSRVVGYYRPVSGWNPGKRNEFRERRLFNLYHAKNDTFSSDMAENGDVELKRDKDNK